VHEMKLLLGLYQPQDLPKLQEEKKEPQPKQRPRF